MKNERCKHRNGWYTDRATVWLGRDNGLVFYTDVRMNHPGKVRLRCNCNGCDAVRNVYIQKRGAKVGRPFFPKASNTATKIVA